MNKLINRSTHYLARLWILCFMLASCSRVPAATVRPTVTYPDLIVGFIQAGSEDGWHAMNTASFKEAAQPLGITLKFYDAQGRLDNQLEAFHQFNHDPQVNVIVLAALQANGYEEVLREARANGKVVVLEDRRIGAPEDLYTTYVGPDFTGEGHRAAVEMCRFLEGSDRKNVVELVGDSDSDAATERSAGFREGIGDCGIQITAAQIANWDTDQARQVMEAWLKNSEDIQGVFAQNDDMSLGAIQAIQEAGLEAGSDIKVIAVGALPMNGNSSTEQALKAGQINVLVEYNPLLAPQVYEAALRALNGETLPKWIPSQEGVIYPQYLTQPPAHSHY